MKTRVYLDFNKKHARLTLGKQVPAVFYEHLYLLLGIELARYEVPSTGGAEFMNNKLLEDAELLLRVRDITDPKVRVSRPGEGTSMLLTRWRALDATVRLYMFVCFDGYTRSSYPALKLCCLGLRLATGGPIAKQDLNFEQKMRKLITTDEDLRKLPRKLKDKLRARLRAAVRDVIDYPLEG